MAARGGHRRILMLTNVELGEANVFLATSHALLQADPDVELHLASFAALRDRVARVSDSVPRARPIVFHQIDGPSMAEGIESYMDRNRVPRQRPLVPDSFRAPLRLSTSLRALGDVVPVFVPYDGPQLVEVVSSIAAIIDDVAADLVVVNSLMTAGLTACYHKGVKFSCLSPNSIKPFAESSLPRLASLWKFPALFSGYPYPVPYHLIPINVFLLLYLALIWLRDPHRQQATEYLRVHAGIILRTPLDLKQNRPPDLKILVSSYPELDYPPIRLVRLPHVFPCGPIVRPGQPVGDADPELLTWLAQGPTIYVNLGSLFHYDKDEATELAQALKMALDTLDGLRWSNVQVLWKLGSSNKACNGEPALLVRDGLGQHIHDGRVRIVAWVQADPISILQSGHVACSVHHGGANSFNEAILAGVPQVVLPSWTDCYDNAQLVEVLGIGRIGSKATKPRWIASELSRELLAVLHGEAAETMAQKAKELASMCETRGNGAMCAARILLEECGTGHPKGLVGGRDGGVAAQ